MKITTRIARGLAKNADQLISELGFEQKKILLISDEKIWENCGSFFLKNFTEILLLKNPKADEKNLKKIFAAIKNHDLIFAFGSGTINDLCKVVSAQKNIPYVVFASAASMNGYLSKNASITIRGYKKTLPATSPIAIFCDLEILAKAPLRLTKAGIGDSLCFYSCWFDWYLSHKILGTKFDKKPFEMLEEKMNFFVKNYKKFSLRDEKFLRLLMEILLLSGQGMARAGGSYPASQSEHMIAHAIEMKYPEIAAKKLHGEMIAVTSLTSARLQASFLRSSVLRIKDDVVENKIIKFFGKKIAAECQKEYSQKLHASENSKQLTSKIITELQKIYFDESKLRAIFSHFKIPTSVKSLGLSNQQYQDCVAHAKFSRNRFTCLDLIS